MVMGEGFQIFRKASRALTTTLPLAFTVVASAWPAPAAWAQAQGDSCRRYTLDRYLWVHKRSSHAETPLSHVIALAESVHANDPRRKRVSLAVGPWEKGLVPLLSAQKDALQDALAILGDSELKNLDQVQHYLRAPSPKSFRRPLTKVNEPPKTLRSLLEASPEQDYLARMNGWGLITAACAQMSVLKAISCGNAVSEIISLARYRQKMILPQIWVEFSESEDLREGLRRMALRMIERIKNPRQSPANVLSELVQSYQEAGMNTRDATDSAWKILALFGNGGHNTGYQLQFFDFPNPGPALVSMHVFATALTLIDFQQNSVGQSHYAYPTEVIGSCLTPKPYHFWLSAYFARRLRQAGYSEDVSAMASFIAAKAYQVNRDIGNQKVKAFNELLEKPKFHPSNQVIRVDLTLAAAGSRFGAQSAGGTTWKLNLPSALQTLVASAGEPTPLDMQDDRVMTRIERIQALRAWDALFAPNVVFNYFSRPQSKH